MTADPGFIPRPTIAKIVPDRDDFERNRIKVVIEATEPNGSILRYADKPHPHLSEQCVSEAGMWPLDDIPDGYDPFVLDLRVDHARLVFDALSARFLVPSTTGKVTVPPSPPSEDGELREQVEWLRGQIDWLMDLVDTLMTDQRRDGLKEQRAVLADLLPLIQVATPPPSDTKP